jgi:general secretion pathway protein L
MPEPDIEYSPEVTGGRRPGPDSGVWSLGVDGLVLTDADWTGSPVVLVPTEDVRLLGVDLPIPNRARRAAALPFVLEDEVSEPIEALHVVLGGELSPGRHLAGIVRHERMTEWCEAIDAAGLEAAAVVPDALSLPPADFGCWSVAANAGRVMARGHDGTAFAVPASSFSAIWKTADRPRLISYGGSLPGEFMCETGVSAGPGNAALADPGALDLRQGPYARKSNRAPWMRRLLLVAAIGVLGHAAIYTVDTVALIVTADARRAEVAELVATAGGPINGDLAATAESMLPHTGSPSGLLPLLVRASEALQPVGQTIAFQSVAYEGATGLTMEVEASDLAALQAVETALRGAGLGPVGRGAAAEGGRARQTIVLPPQGGTP